MVCIQIFLITGLIETRLQGAENVAGSSGNFATKEVGGEATY